jgi:hypothetical protein
MKKDYGKPEMLVEELLLESSMLTTSIPQGEAGLPADAPGRREGRGVWGDLWSRPTQE